MKKLIMVVATAVILAVLANVVWEAYGETQISEAAEFDASIGMVHHQTGRMEDSLNNAGAFVKVEVEDVRDISALLKAWAPKYEAALLAYRKFDAAIIAAEQSAAGYFAAQRALTERYKSKELKAKAEAVDEEDFKLYERWKDRAHSVRDEALTIVDRLSDMETDLRKLELSAEFTFDAGGFDEVPSEIAALGEELAQFQLASENIRAITASPFDPNR